MNAQDQSLDAVVQEEIARRAYSPWEAAGRPNSPGQEFWLQAERELRPKLGTNTTSAKPNSLAAPITGKSALANAIKTAERPPQAQPKRKPALQNQDV